MPEENKNSSPEEQVPYATPTKRILAWIGVAYMALFVLLNLYPFFHGGAYLKGIGPLLVCPGVLGMAALCVCRLREQTAPFWKRGILAGMAVLCVIVLLLGLIDGIPALIAGLTEGTP